MLARDQGPIVFCLQEYRQSNDGTKAIPDWGDMPSLPTETQDKGRSRAVQNPDTLVDILRVGAAGVLRDIVFLIRVFRHADTPWHAKCLLSLPLLYLGSPIQLIPNFIPLLGQMDDLLLIWLTKKLARKVVDEKTWQECHDAATQTRLAFPGRFVNIARRTVNLDQELL